MDGAGRIPAGGWESPGLLQKEKHTPGWHLVFQVGEGLNAILKAMSVDKTIWIPDSNFHAIKTLKVQ